MGKRLPVVLLGGGGREGVKVEEFGAEGVKLDSCFTWAILMEMCCRQ